MGTVCPSSLLGGLVDLDVLDDQVAGVETLGISVGLGVLEETEKELGGLDGPSSLGDTELLAYSHEFHQHTLLSRQSPTTSLQIVGVSIHRIIETREAFRVVRTLGASTNAASKSSHGNSLLVLLDVLEEGNSALELPAVDGLGGLAGVLERNSEIGTAGAGRFRGLNLSCGVSNLSWERRKCQSSSSLHGCFSMFCDPRYHHQHSN